MGDLPVFAEPVTRRDFLAKTAAGAAAFLVGGSRWLGALGTVLQDRPKLSVTDRVRLGKTKVMITRLGLGTGTVGGKLQRDLGVEGFTKLVRHAYDRGLRYVDTADNYRMHDLVGKAIKGLPREELVVLSKMRIRPDVDVAADLDRFRRELDTEYLDIVLIHCAMKPGWPADLQKMRDGLSAAKDKGVVRAVGVSCHGLPGLREVAGCEWVEVSLARINHDGTKMDGPTGAWTEPGDQAAGAAEVRKIHDAGKGVLAMKVMGEGAYKTPEQRVKAIQYVVKSGIVDAMTIGFKSAEEVDEAMERINRALNG